MFLGGCVVVLFCFVCLVGWLVVLRYVCARVRAFASWFSVDRLARVADLQACPTVRKDQTVIVYTQQNPLSHTYNGFTPGHSPFVDVGRGF